MTQFYNTSHYNIDHTTFGGYITLYDFEGHQTIQSMADKIAQDLRFDKRCMENLKNRQRQNNYKKGSN